MDGQSIGQASHLDQRIGAMIAAAKRAARDGRAMEADRLMRQAEAEAPRHPLVLNENALRLIAVGDHPAARAILQAALDNDPANAELWFNLAVALRGLYRIGDALAALDRALTIEPRHLRALLEKGALLELQEQPRAAAISYRLVLLLLPAHGPLPRWMEAQLRHAQACVEANNRALELYIEEGLGDLRTRFADEPLDRFDQCVATMVQKRGVFRQQPAFMHFPELPAIEFDERDRFPCSIGSRPPPTISVPSFAPR